MDKNMKAKLADYFAAQPVDVVYLFGSQATGKANTLSDIDIAILFSKDVDPDLRYAIKLDVLGMTSGGKLPDHSDVVDINDAPLALAYQAIFPKYILFMRNKNHMCQFEASTVKKYLDFRPTLYAISRRHIELIAQKGLVV